MILLYDGTWPGFLSCVFECFKRKLWHYQIKPRAAEQVNFFGDEICMETNFEQAWRVQKGLQGRLSAEGFRQIRYSFLSEMPDVETLLLHYFRYLFSRPNAEKDLSHQAVLDVHLAAKRVSREAHRMKAFVRFALTESGIYYALINPDYNVLPLIVTHFQKRYADQPWIIFDERRNYGVYYDLKSVTELKAATGEGPAAEADPGGLVLHEEEGAYQALWKDYIVAATISSRKNTKLHLRHVPKRYWRYLTEDFSS